VNDSADASCVAVVTGAASGMGRATAAKLLHEGWLVAAVDVDRDGLARAAKELGVGLLGCVADVTDRAAVEQCLGSALSGDQELRAVVNAAGIYPPTRLSDYTEESYRRIMDINLLGTLNVTAAALPHFQAHGKKATVVNFASVDAFAVSPGQLVYSAAKAALVSVTRSLAVELAPDVLVNAVAPGWVDTPANRALGRMQAAIAGIPLQRAAQPAEVADWVVHLCRSDSYITGETIVISGGAMMR